MVSYRKFCCVDVCFTTECAKVTPVHSLKYRKVLRLLLNFKVYASEMTGQNISANHRNHLTCLESKS